MNFTPYPILDWKFGKVSQRDAWLLPKDAFTELTNCHIKRGVLEKRKGYEEFGRLVKTSTTAGTDTNPALAVMGLLTYNNGASEYLLACDTKRINKWDTVTSAFVDLTRHKVHVKHGGVQNHTPLANDVVGCLNTITHFADAGSGKVTVTTSIAHGLENGTTVYITGTTNYNGTFVVSEKAATTFKIVDTWVADDATGTAEIIATIESVVLDHGAWLSGNADGTIIFKNVTATNAFRNGATLVDHTNHAEIFGVADGASSDDEFTGDDTNFFRITNWYDIAYITNSVDQICKYDGTSLSKLQIDLDVDGGADNDITRCLLIVVYHGRLIIFDTTERGTRYRKRARWCQANNPQIWPDENYLDNDKTNDYIVSAGFIGEDLYVRFSNSLWRYTYTGDADLPFQWDLIAQGGCYAIDSMVTYQVQGQDRLLNVNGTSLIETDGRSSYDINIVIPDEVVGWNLTYISYSNAINIEADKQIFISYVSQAGTKPDRVLVYNYENQSFAIYELPAHCFGKSKLSSDLILDNIETTLDDIDYSFDDESNQAGYPTILMGCTTGYVYKLNSSSADNGTDIEFIAKSGQWNPFIEENSKAYLGKLCFLVDRDDDVTFDVQFFKDGSTEIIKTASITCDGTSLNEDKVLKTVYFGEQARFHSIKITNDNSVRPRIHSIIPYFAKGAKIY
ncbi:MAG: hypothetical protein WC356_02730 [Candidatus Micrarchaeia archaeon]|jgi:hypothetical protein